MSASQQMVDRDNDGILDRYDDCPDEPEDHDGFIDGDGCVDRDNDGDHVLDAHEFKNGRWTNCDRMLEDGVDLDCRNQPEDVDGDNDQDGCPDVACFASCILRLPERLHFDRRGRPLSDNEKLLDVLAATMQTAPTMRFWIEAHMDAQRDASTAQTLTQRMADATVEALASRGVARERLEPRALGDKVSLADNRSEAGRAANRRVDFTLIHNCCGSGAGIRHLWDREAGVVPAALPTPPPTNLRCH